MGWALGNSILNKHPCCREWSSGQSYQKTNSKQNRRALWVYCLELCGRGLEVLRISAHFSGKGSEVLHQYLSSPGHVCKVTWPGSAIASASEAWLRCQGEESFVLGFSRSLVALMSGFETPLWQPHPLFGNFAIMKGPICFT